MSVFIKREVLVDAVNFEAFTIPITFFFSLSWNPFGHVLSYSKHCLVPILTAFINLYSFIVYNFPGKKCSPSWKMSVTCHQSMHVENIFRIFSRLAVSSLILGWFSSLRRVTPFWTSQACIASSSLLICPKMLRDRAQIARVDSFKVEPNDTWGSFPTSHVRSLHEEIGPDAVPQTILMSHDVLSIFEAL